jgi:hypothetical protein
MLVPVILAPRESAYYEPIVIAATPAGAATSG